MPTNISQPQSIDDPAPTMAATPEPMPIDAEKELGQVASYIVDLWNTARQKVDGKPQLNKLDDYRQQYDGTYQLKWKTTFNECYVAFIGSMIRTLVTELEKNLGVLLAKDTKSLIEAHISPGERLRRWKQMTKATQLRAATLAQNEAMLGIDVGDRPATDPQILQAEFKKDLEKVDAQLELETMAFEMRIQDLARRANFLQLAMESIWKGGVTGTAPVTVARKDDALIGRVIRPENYIVSNPLCPGLAQQSWRIERNGLSRFDLYDMESVVTATGAKMYVGLDKLPAPGNVGAVTDKGDNPIGDADYERFIFCGRVDWTEVFSGSPEDVEEGIAALKGAQPAAATDPIWNSPDFDPMATIWWIEVIDDQCVSCLPSDFPAKFPDVVFTWSPAADECFFGVGAYGMGAANNEKLANLMSQLADMATMRGVAPMVYVDQSGLDPTTTGQTGVGSQLSYTPGRVIRTVRDPKTVVMPDSVDVNIIQLANGVEAKKVDQLRTLTGATAQLAGQGDADTATQSTIDLQQGMTAVGFSASRADQFFKELLQMFRLLDPEPQESQVYILGSEPMTTEAPEMLDFDVFVTRDAAQGAQMAMTVANLVKMVPNGIPVPGIIDTMAGMLGTTTMNSLRDPEAEMTRRAVLKAQKANAELTAATAIMQQKALLAQAIMSPSGAPEGDGAGAPAGPGGPPGQEDQEKTRTRTGRTGNPDPKDSLAAANRSTLPGGKTGAK